MKRKDFLAVYGKVRKKTCAAIRVVIDVCKGLIKTKQKQKDRNQNKQIGKNFSTLERISLVSSYSIFIWKQNEINFSKQVDNKYEKRSKKINFLKIF